MTDNIAVGIYPTAGKLAAPDYIILGVERYLDLYTIAFGFNPDKSLAIPNSLGTAIILGYHEGAMSHLI